ncbi:MAG: hypothetical protein LBV52_07130 [Spirochaetaceae bacterium]|jgi:hypothetical protein|nr:hypothetical protein [Spirochaetaceae bacterium]
MRKTALQLTFLLSAVFICGINAMGNSDSGAGKDGESVIISGTVRIVGSEPFTEIVVTDENGTDWFIDSAEKNKLYKYQGTTVNVKGNLYLTDIVLADGNKIGVRRTLKNVSIIRI